ncbi:class I SAM-dependent methyltransferase [Paenibacillus sacheonensis]|uniref:Methyltransferase domain-containing protein n=1 Tax=Paenibacillus sacheonensis TaxID=742054 RepID=A0A7X4YLP9_9BACL|nr:class I SAM-dependent methyltransferase [Paenibacillus sacheonensis]MBM7563889.1 SAM-dependent methyltransferase [Paenibacillus sacheonensis]NBC67764.1 methyltransferase domain-containing protein [Paenibacillus sacheonensis]
MAFNQGTYQGIVASTYDIWFSGDRFDDTDFYKKFMDEVPGAALEIGCGTGRLLLPYLTEGYDVEGVDCSAEMLELCTLKASARGVSPVLHNQLIQELRLPKTYKTIYIPMASLMCVSERDEAIRALAGIFNHLDYGGQVLIPLFIPRNVNTDEWKVSRSGIRSDGAEVILSSISSVIFHDQVQTNQDKYEVLKDGELLDTVFTTSKLRWYGKYEFIMMLEKIGFQAIVVYGGYNLQPLNDDQNFMIFRARK